MDKRGFLLKLILAIFLIILVLGSVFGYIFYVNYVKPRLNEINSLKEYTSVSETNLTNETQIEGDPLVKICNSSTEDVYINKCGNYYQTYYSGYTSKENKQQSDETNTTPIVADGDTKYYDAEGTFLISCGGYKAYADEEARAEEQENCAKIAALANYIPCNRILDSCFELYSNIPTYSN